MPTKTPTNTPSPGKIIDDFEGYSNNAALHAVYGVNNGWVNVGQLSLASPPNVSSGIRGAAFHYEIKDREIDYSGFEQTMHPRDWRGYGGLGVWVKGEDSGIDLVIQFREAGGEVWKYRVSLSTFDVKDFWIPFDTSLLESDVPPGHRANGRIDLGAIDYYGFFLGNGGLNSGTIYVDDFRLIP